MKIKSGYAWIDVKAGRGKLRKHFHADRDGRLLPLERGAPAPGDRIPIIITGFLTGAHSSDDGISQEFEIKVGKVEVHG